MDLKGIHQFGQVMERQLSELGIESTYVEGIGSPQIGDTLRILFPVTEEGHPVIAELMVTEFAEDVDLLHFYTTLIVEMNDKADNLPELLSDWNLLCPLGAYGIYVDEEDEEQGRQLFHKYSIAFPVDATPAALANEAMQTLSLLYGVLSEKYEEFAEYMADEDE